MGCAGAMEDDVVCIQCSIPYFCENQGPVLTYFVLALSPGQFFFHAVEKLVVVPLHQVHQVHGVHRD